jgi:hypothetical protein
VGVQRREELTGAAVSVSGFAAFSLPMESEAKLLGFVLTRFLDANRFPLRLNTL